MRVGAFWENFRVVTVFGDISGYPGTIWNFLEIFRDKFEDFMKSDEWILLFVMLFKLSLLYFQRGCMIRIIKLKDLAKPHVFSYLTS